MTVVTPSLNDGNIAVWAVASIADPNAPTTAEIIAGMYLSHWLPEDGLKGFKPETAMVDSSRLDSKFTSGLPGRAEYKNQSLTFIAQLPVSGDTFKSTFIRDYTTYIVIRRDQPAPNVSTTGDLVEVYPMNCGEREEEDTPKNSLHKYTIPFIAYDEPNLNAVVT